MKKIFSVILLSVTAYAGWNISKKTDEMTNEVSYYAISDSVSATKTMDFPYHNVEAKIVIGCNNKSSWAYLYFTEVPNLLDTSLEDGYYSILLRIKYNDNVEKNHLIQRWGSKNLFFSKEKHIINKIKTSKNMLVELNWFGNGLTYFNFQLDGADKAIKEIDEKCKI